MLVQVSRKKAQSRAQSETERCFTCTHDQIFSSFKILEKINGKTISSKRRNAIAFSLEMMQIFIVNLIEFT